MQDIDWRGRYDKRGVLIQHVGTVGIKHTLYARLSTDADKAPENRLGHFSDELSPEYFAGLVSESYNPSKNRFEKKRGARNEPLDTFVYAYAATHHPELRLHRATKADWDRLEARLIPKTEKEAAPAAQPETREPSPLRQVPQKPARASGFAKGWKR
jgi:phage terminase large subunit GpA-like protein